VVSIHMFAGLQRLNGSASRPKRWRRRSPGSVGSPRKSTAHVHDRLRARFELVASHKRQLTACPR
jgi:hypothetical protein